MRLISKDFNDDFISVILTGKSRTFISSSLLHSDLAVLADWGGNVWCIDITTKKKIWSKKLKKPIIRPFISYNDKTFAISVNTIYSLCIRTGEFVECYSLKEICSVVHGNEFLYFNSRNKRGQDSIGKIIQFDLNNYTTTVISDDNLKRTFSEYTRLEICIKESDLWYFAGGVVCYRDIATGNSKSVLSIESAERIYSIIQLNDSVLVTPELFDGKPLDPHLSGFNPTSILQIYSDGTYKEIPGTMNRIRFPPVASSMTLGPITIVIIGGYLLSFSEDKLLSCFELNSFGNTENKLFINNGKIYLLSSCSFNEESPSIQGFKLYRLADEYTSLEFVNEYKAYSTGKNFKSCHFDIYGDKLVIRGDRIFFILELK